jgi:hypothetical protein
MTGFDDLDVGRALLTVRLWGPAFQDAFRKIDELGGKSIPLRKISGALLASYAKERGNRFDIFVGRIKCHGAVALRSVMKPARLLRVGGLYVRQQRTTSKVSRHPG